MDEIRDIMYPHRLTPQLAQVLALKLDQITTAYNDACKTLDVSIHTCTKRVSIASLPKQIAKDIKRMAKIQNELTKLRVSLDRYILVDNKTVVVRETPAETSARQKDHSEKRSLAYSQYKARLNALREVGLLLLAANVAAIKAKIPTDLITKLDAI